MENVSVEQKLPYDLAYFAEWGSRKWQTLLQHAIGELQKDNALQGAELLEIGTGYGKLAVLFALLGARVTGVDVLDARLTLAREEAKRWKVAVDFRKYDGNLDIFPDESFDVICTKSVLVILPDLENVLKTISRKLKPNGRVVFLENGWGSPFLHALRALKHRTWNYRSARYFTEKEVKLIESVFRMDCVKKTRWPPIYLLMGRKR
jgi:ubiquinone/menaquinone biosynthesis C-methylase UbiE